MTRHLGHGAALVAAALLGGGLALGVDSALDDDGSTTVLREVSVAGGGAPSFAASAGGRTIGEIYESAAAGVVQVTSDAVVADDPVWGPQRARSLGSGFVIDKAGHIVTNFHVVEGADQVEVNFTGEDRMRATVVGVDPSTDIAVLQVDAHARALAPLPLGDSELVEVGDAVVAIGNPFGLERSVSAGIVSAIQRELPAPNGFAIAEVIQTDAAINEGNSGGPLLNADGEVIGVNAQIATAGGTGNAGVGFAIPVNTVRAVVSQLIETGRAEHTYLGIEGQTIDERLSSTFRLPVARGVLIARVRPESPADRAGLAGGTTRVVVDGQSYVLGGDVVVAVDGRAIGSFDELRAAIVDKEPGDLIRLELVREEARKTVSVTLGRQPTTSVP